MGAMNSGGQGLEALQPHQGLASAVRSRSAPGFFPDARGSSTSRFCVLFEIQSFHHLSNSACPLVFGINLPIYSSTQWSIPWELSHLPARLETIEICRSGKIDLLHGREN